jgi:hypothetical protein
MKNIYYKNIVNLYKTILNSFIYFYWLDKYYEYFWLSFKQSIDKSSSIYIKNEISNYSTIMNLLQKQQKYDDILLCIEDFFSNNINRIIAETYLLNQGKIGLLKTNIHRLIKFQPSFIIKSIEYHLLNVIINMINNKKYDKIHLIDKYINNYFEKSLFYNKYSIGCLLFNQQTQLNEDLYTIVNLGIKNNMISLIDACAQHIDITLFYKNNIDKNKFKIVKGTKLIKLLEQKSINDLISS